MAGFKGQSSIFYIKISGVRYPISCEVNSNLSESTELVETTTRDNTGGWKTSLPTKQSYTISFSGMMVQEDVGTVSYWTLVDAKRNRALIEWEQELSAIGSKIGGKAYISSIEMTNTVDEFIMFNITFEGFGKINYL